MEKILCSIFIPFYTIGNVKMSFPVISSKNIRNENGSFIINEIYKERIYSDHILFVYCLCAQRLPVLLLYSIRMFSDKSKMTENSLIRKSRHNK